MPAKKAVLKKSTRVKGTLIVVWDVVNQPTDEKWNEIERLVKLGQIYEKKLKYRRVKKAWENRYEMHINRRFLKVS